MANRLEKLADDLMNLSQDEAQQLQNIIKAKLLPEVERQRGLLNDQMSIINQKITTKAEPKTNRTVANNKHDPYPK